jgi:hypothetical protein
MQACERGCMKALHVADMHTFLSLYSTFSLNVDIANINSYYLLILHIIVVKLKLFSAEHVKTCRYCATS